jgi:hypothetical protein
MVRLIAVFALALITATAQAQAPIKATVASTPLLLPVPAGFTEPSEAVPILRKNAETITAPPMRLLAVYVDDKDREAAEKGNTPSFKRYFMVQVLRAREGDVLDERAFSEVKSQVTGLDPAKLAKVSEDLRTHIGSAAKRIGSEAGVNDLALSVGVPRQMGVFYETESAVSTLLVTRASASTASSTLERVVGQATSTVLLRGKVVFFAAYSEINDGSDYAWLRSASQAWVEAALAANAR